MKISNAVIFLVIIAGIFFIFALMIEESNTQYPEANLNSSAWKNQFDYIDRINESVDPLRIDLLEISKEDTGWFKKITTGITAIPKVITIVPATAFNTLVFASLMIGDFFAALKIPQKILTAVILMIFIFLLYKLIEFISNRTRV